MVLATTTLFCTKGVDTERVKKGDIQDKASNPTAFLTAAISLNIDT